MEFDDEDKSLQESFDNLLSYYGIQLQSHASIVIGLTVAFFAVFQAWGQLESVSNATMNVALQLTVVHRIGFATVIGALGLLLTYMGQRLFVYGNASSAIISCTKQDFSDAKTAYVNAVKQTKEEVEQKKRRSSLQPWSDLSDFAKINVYTSRVLRNRILSLLKVGVFVSSAYDVTGGVRWSFWPAATTSAIFFVLSYGLFFGTGDWYTALTWGALFFLILEAIHFHRFPRRNELSKEWRWVIRRSDSLSSTKSP